MPDILSILSGFNNSGNGNKNISIKRSAKIFLMVVNEF